MVDFELLVKKVYASLKVNGDVLSVAESCTGGWVAKVMTDYAGSSDYFDRGFVTYTNASKEEMLNVKSVTLNQCGAVSTEVVADMAEGALAHSQASVSLAISGIAGPGGATEHKPVGLVCFAWKIRDNVAISDTEIFKGSREAVREQAVEYALKGLIERLN